MILVFQYGRCFRFQSKGQESPAVSFSSHLEEKQLKLCVEVSEIRSYRLSEDGNQVETNIFTDGFTV